MEACTERPPLSIVRRFRRWLFAPFTLEKKISSTAYTIWWGITAPCLCLLLDPIVFKGGLLGEGGFLADFAATAYLSIPCGMGCLVVFLWLTPASSLLGGMLFGFGICAALLGCLLFPLSLVGLFVVIGIAGFTPLFTGFFYIRAGLQTLYLAKTKQSALKCFTHFCLGLLLPCALAYGMQLKFNQLNARGLTEIVSPAPDVQAQGVQRLKSLGIAFNREAFREAALRAKDDPKIYKQFEEAYLQLTNKRLDVIMNPD